jgi:hypothetical protein
VAPLLTWPDFVCRAGKTFFAGFLSQAEFALITANSRTNRGLLLPKKLLLPEIAVIEDC